MPVIRFAVVAAALVGCCATAAHAAPAHLLRDINTEGMRVSSSPTLPVVRGGLAFFEANDGRGSALWRSDGTFDGTTRLAALDEPIEYGALVDGMVFITLNPRRFPPVRRVWRTDGTADGTGPVTDQPPFDPHLATEWRGATYYFDRDEHGSEGFWRSGVDGQPRTLLIEGDDLYTQPVAAGEHLYFYSYSAQLGSELWRTDGTPDGTEIVRDIFPGASGSEPGYGAEYWRALGHLVECLLSSERQCTQRCEYDR